MAYVAEQFGSYHYVSKINNQKGMCFYNQHVLKSSELWEKILWTGESMIRISYSHGRIIVWRRKVEQFSYTCSKPTMKSLRKGLMVWDCMSVYGVGKIVVFEGKVSADVY